MVYSSQGSFNWVVRYWSIVANNRLVSYHNINILIDIYLHEDKQKWLCYDKTDFQSAKPSNKTKQTDIEGREYI